MRQPSELPSPLQRTAFDRADALRHGLDDNRMRRSNVIAPFRGVHISADARPTSIRSLCEAYAPRLRPGQFFSHRTAVVLWGLTAALSRSGPFEVDVAVCAGAGWPPDARGVRGHVVGGDAPDVRLLRGLPVSDVGSAWRQLGTVAGLDELITVGDAAVFRPRYPQRGDPRPHTSIPELAESLERYRGRGKRRLQAALALVREGVESPMETALRLLLDGDGAAAAPSSRGAA